MPLQLAIEAASLAAEVIRSRDVVAGVDAEAVQIGTTPKDEIWRDGGITLYRYQPMIHAPLSQPVLLAYALVGRFTVADLQPDRSLIRRLLEQGLDVYVIDWGHPTRADRWMTIDDYVNGVIDECVMQIRDRHNGAGVNLLGICQGGIFHLCYAALHPENVQTVIPTVTPVDFHRARHDTQVDRGFVHTWAEAMTSEDIDQIVDAVGNLPGQWMAAAFGLMHPISQVSKYGLGLLDVTGNEDDLMNFLRMEKWLADRPAHTAESVRQWLKDFYQGNKLFKGELMLGGHRVDLGNVKCPVLNVYAEHDLIAPPACSKALRDVIGSVDYSELALPGGHIGVFVGRRAQKDLAPAIAAFVRDRA
jgi:polyhydroxyalkanoate synthase